MKDTTITTWIVSAVLSISFLAPMTARAGNTCPAASVEVRREIVRAGANTDTRIYCLAIAELSAGDIMALSPNQISALPPPDLKDLEQRAASLGVVIPPSEIVSPEERDFLVKQLAMLQARRDRGERELAKVKASRESIDQEALANAAVVRDLNADSIVHSLEALDLVLFEMRGKIPPAQTASLHSTINFAKVIGNAMSTSLSEPLSTRQAAKLGETLNAVKNLLPAQAVGMDPEELEAIKSASDTLPKLAEISQKIAETPMDKQVWSDWLSCLDDWLEVASKVHPAATGVYATAHLIDEQVALWYLRHDAEDLRAAGVASQTAQRYWIGRIGEIDDLQRIYQERLDRGMAGNGRQQ